MESDHVKSVQPEGRRGSDPLCHVRLQGFVPDRSDGDIRKMPPAWDDSTAQWGPEAVESVDSWGQLSRSRKTVITGEVVREPGSIPLE